MVLSKQRAREKEEDQGDITRKGKKELRPPQPIAGRALQLHTKHSQAEENGPIDAKGDEDCQ
jgi:hypothetical protein